MKTLASLFDQLGRPVGLGPKLGTGGEGSVFDMSGSPGLVAKVYHKALSTHHEAKVRAMVGMARKELFQIAAWPTGTLHDKPGGPVRGLVMRRVSGCKELHTL